MKNMVLELDSKSRLASQIRDYWRGGSATCLQRGELKVPQNVHDWFVSQLIVDKKTGSVVEFMNERSCLISQFGPRRWTVILDLIAMDSCARSMGSDFAPIYVRNFLKKAMARRCYSLLLENVDAEEMSEWVEI